jgi:DNA-binding beta-propeller fold protein YncE
MERRTNTVNRRLWCFIAAATIFAGLAHAQEAKKTAPLRLAQTIPLPKGYIHFDHFGVDAKGKRLFATFEDHNTVEVFDLANGKILHSIPGFQVPHNVLYLPGMNEVVITDGAGTFNLLRGDTLDRIKTVKLAINADFVVFDPRRQLFYVTNGGHAAKMNYGLVSVIDKEGNHLDDIKIDGAHIEFLAAEDAGPRMFIGISDKHAIGVIDRDKRQVVDTWVLPDAEENIPLVLDNEHQRLFVVTRKPAKLFVLDSNSGKVLATLPSVGDSDDMAFDAKHHRIYVSGGDGFVAVYQQDDADHYTFLGNFATGAGGGTSTFVPELDRMYIGVRRGPSGAQLQIVDVVP